MQGLRADGEKGTVWGAQFIDVTKIPPAKRQELREHLTSFCQSAVEDSMLGGIAVAEATLDGMRYMQSVRDSYKPSDRFVTIDKLVNEFELPREAGTKLVDLFEFALQHGAIVEPKSNTSGAERMNCALSCSVTAGS